MSPSGGFKEQNQLLSVCQPFYICIILGSDRHWGPNSTPGSSLWVGDGNKNAWGAAQGPVDWWPEALSSDLSSGRMWSYVPTQTRPGANRLSGRDLRPPAGLWRQVHQRWYRRDKVWSLFQVENAGSPSQQEVKHAGWFCFTLFHLSVGLLKGLWGQ